MPAETLTGISTGAGTVPVRFTSDTVWAYWNTTPTSVSLSTATTTNEAVWTAWNTTVTLPPGTYTITGPGVITGTIQGTWQSWNIALEETREQAEAREAAAAAAAERAREADREREAAKARALELLSFCLTPAQLASYQEKGWFEVRGSRGRRWRIRDRGQSGNVDLMPEIGDEREASYCAHPPGGLPHADAHLAQMLAIVTDEDAFERVANLHYRRPTRRAA